MSQSNFMRNLRMTMPQYVTNITSFNDAVKILKNKAILTEAALGENNLLDELESEMENGNSYAEAISAVAAKHNIDEDTLATKYPEEAVGNKAYADNYPGIYESDPSRDAELGGVEDDFKQLLAKGYSYYEALELIAQNTGMDPDELESMFPQDAVDTEEYEDDELDAIIKRMEDELDSPDKYKNQDYEGGLGEDLKTVKEPNPNAGKYRIMSIDGKNVIANDFFDSMEAAQEYARKNIRTSHKIVKLPAERSVYRKIDEAKKKKEPKAELHPNLIHPQELRMGIKVELEHTDDLDKAKKIALDHLAENPYYYTALKLSGIESPSAPKVKAPVEKKAKKKKEAVELVDKANAMQKVKMPKVVKEVYTAAALPGEEINDTTKKVLQYVDSDIANPTLKALSKDISLQNLRDNRTLLRYRYWEPLPDNAIRALELQFKVEGDTDIDDDTAPREFYILSPKSSAAKDLGSSLEMGASKAGKMDAFKEALEKLVREVIAETFDGRDNLDAKNEGLTPDEQEIVDDILETLQEGMFDKSKFMSYLKKGLITASIIGALLGSTQLNFDQKQDIVDAIKTEKTMDQDIQDIADARLAIDYYNMNKAKADKAAENDFDLQQVIKGINNITSQKAENNKDVLQSFGKNYKSQIEKLIKVN